MPMNYELLEQDEMMYLDGGGVGKNWWNKTSFVGNVIDAVSFLIPALSSFYALRKVGELAKSGRTYIRTNISDALRKAGAGFTVATVSFAVDMLFLVYGGSIGSWISLALDYSDGRRDGHIYA